MLMRWVAFACLHLDNMVRDETNRNPTRKNERKETVSSVDRVG